jgi:hypothetical protein
MRDCHRSVLALALSIALTGAPAAYAQTPGSAVRSQLDSELARATDLGQLLQVANRYADAGYQQEAKSIVDRAAQKARSSGDWQSVSAAYLRLGYTDSANAAQRRSRETTR